MRGTIKPGVAAHTTGTLPIPSSKAFTLEVTAEAVAAPGEISTEWDQIGRI